MRIALQGLRFVARHGAEPWEAEVDQVFSVDVVLDLDSDNGAQTDDLADAIDYREVFASVRAVMMGPRMKLIESIAARIASEICAGSNVRRADVTLKKYKPAIGGDCEYAWVNVVRDRA